MNEEDQVELPPAFVDGRANNKGRPPGPYTGPPKVPRLNYTHDALIDTIIARPTATHKELAEVFGYSSAWVHKVVNTDLFRARLAARKAEIVDPVLVASVEEQLDALASRSISILLDRLDLVPSVDLATKALEITTRARAYGARDSKAPIQNNFVVVVPEKAGNSASWADKHTVVSTQGVPSNDP